MIKSFSATTREIDEPENAVAEILATLDLDNNMLKHSLGIISCFADFEETGALKAICDALPFECVGATSCVCACNDEVDQIMFSITVLTSDDCEFKTVVIPVGEDYKLSIKTVFAGTLNETKEKPALIISYFPLVNELSGDMILTEIDKAVDSVPIFGTIAIDHNMDYKNAKTICNGEAYRETVVLGAIYGAPKISFKIASLNENKIRKQRAIITESDGNILMGVNGKTALEYLEEIGLTRTEILTGLSIIPLVVDDVDGTKSVTRAVFAVTKEGYVFCGGKMPVDATLSIGRIERDDVMLTTEDALKDFVEKDSVIFGYSCLARYLCLGADNTAEAEKVKEMAVGTKYIFACSGGEICPLPDAQGKLKNLFHNYSSVFCKLS